jgi:hypothetical protein
LSDLFAAEYPRAHLPDDSELPKHTRWLADSIQQHRADTETPDPANPGDNSDAQGHQGQARTEESHDEIE